MSLTWSTETDTLKTSEADGVLTLTIDLPGEANRITPDALAKIEQIARELAQRDDINCVVLTAVGTQHFSSGLLNPTLRAQWSKDDVLALVRLANRTLNALSAVPQIVIAALNGEARAGGLETALACDIRVAADTVTMHLPEAGWGGFPGAGAPSRLAAIVGRGKALQLIATGVTIDAKEMHRLGIVEEVVPATELGTSVAQMARRIASAGPLATRGAKQIVRTRLDPGEAAAALLADRLRYDLEWSADVDEAHAAQKEGRAPRFKGR